MGRLMDDDFRPYRDELFIATKAGYDMWPGPYGNWGSRKYLMASLAQSLRRMHLDYVDLFYSHRYDPDTPLEETLQALVDVVRAGDARLRNDRILNMLELTGFTNRLIEQIGTNYEEPLNFSVSNNILQQEKARALAYLKEIVNKPGGSSVC